MTARFVQLTVAIAFGNGEAGEALYALDGYGGVWRFSDRPKPGAWHKMPDRRIPPASDAVDEDEQNRLDRAAGDSEGWPLRGGA